MSKKQISKLKKQIRAIDKALKRPARKIKKKA